jgi:putative flippase GtrA
MRDEATAVEIRPASRASPVEMQAHPRIEAQPNPPAETQPHMRLLHGMRRPGNWLQLVRFGLVGGVGFVVNLIVYTLCVHAAGIDYHLAAIAAWLVAVVNNFMLNRHWTFDAGDGRAHFQAVRFVTVSLVALGFSLIVLIALVNGGGVAKVPAQALAVAASMPLNFVGNKLWSFRSDSRAVRAAGP